MFSPTTTDINRIEQSAFQDYDSVLPNKTSSESANMAVADYLIGFNLSKSYCVGCVDIVNSTNITRELGTTKGVKYNQIFLNLMSRVLNRFGGFVIKNIGDCLLYYFPESSKSQRNYGFMSCIECGLSMIENHKALCERMHQEGLPKVDYRISADYGTVVITQTKNSKIDMIGPPVTMCTDINHEAPINEMVIGSDLYERVKGFRDYKFKKTSDFSLGFKFSYPIYTIIRK